MNTVAACVRLLRPWQWVKNAFVLAPVFFAGEIGDLAKLQAAALATLAFCLVASGVYVLNDVNDARHDRLHPTKRLRPIAAGTVTPAQAAVLGLASPAFGLYAASWCAWPTLAIVGTYLVVNIAYCLALNSPWTKWFW